MIFFLDNFYKSGLKISVYDAALKDNSDKVTIN